MHTGEHNSDSTKSTKLNMLNSDDQNKLTCKHTLQTVGIHILFQMDDRLSLKSYP